MNYYVHFPVRDAIKNIKPTVESFLKQTIPAKKIIIVEDGSTDGTENYLAEMQKEYPSIIEVISTGSKTRDYSRIPLLWNMALEKRPECAYQVVGAGDCAFNTDYVEKLIAAVEDNPGVVLASGTYGNVKFIAPLGAGRILVESYFNQAYNGRYPTIVGYESAILEQVLRDKLKLLVVEEARFEHLDKLGHSHNFKEFGYAMRALGYHPLYALARCAIDYMYNTEIGKEGAKSMMLAYLKYKPQDSGYFSLYPKDFRNYVKNRQKKLMLHTIKQAIRNPHVITKRLVK